MAAVNHFRFSKFQIFRGHSVGRANMYHRTKFHQNRSNGCGDTAFNDLKIASVSHFRFLKFEFLIFWTTDEVQKANMRHYAKCHPSRPNGCWDVAIYIFSWWQPSAILDLWGLVLIIRKFKYFAHLAGNAYSRCFLGSKLDITDADSQWWTRCFRFPIFLPVVE